MKTTLQQSTTFEGFERCANGPSSWPLLVGKCRKDHLPVSQMPPALASDQRCDLISVVFHLPIAIMFLAL